MLAPVPLLIHFFSRVPDGWDQAEYSWCVAAGYLPHSPYILYILAGALLAPAANPPSALSALSLVSGVASIGFLVLASRWLPVRLAPRTDEQPPAPLAAMAAGIAYGLSPLFVRQATTQEVYPMQTALLLGSAALLLVRTRHRALLGGATFGCALGTHNGSALVAPALAFAVWSLGGARRIRALGLWAGAAVATYGAVAVFVAVVLPDDPAQARLLQVAGYLRGVAAGFRWDMLADPARLLPSLAALSERVFAVGLLPPWQESPEGAFVIGSGVLRVAAVAVGMGALARRSPRAATFWLFWAAPFLLYEAMLGESVDRDAYLAFVLPAVAVFVGSSVAAVAGWRRWPPRVAGILATGWLALLLAPAAVRFAGEWDEPGKIAAAHFTREVLAAAWMAEHLPGDAVVVGPRLSQNNPNVVPYYSRRRPIILPDQLPVLLRDPRPFTPVNLASFEAVTTERLARLIDEGVAVYAFEDHPIARREGDAAFDPDAFRWVPRARVDVRAVAAARGLPEGVRARLAGDPVVLFQAERALPRAAPESAGPATR